MRHPFTAGTGGPTQAKLNLNEDTVCFFFFNIRIYIYIYTLYLLIDLAHRCSRFLVHCCPAMNTHFSAWASQVKTVADIRYPFESGGLSVILFVLFSQHEMKDLDENHPLKSDVALCCFAIKNSISHFEPHLKTTNPAS